MRKKKGKQKSQSKESWKWMKLLYSQTLSHTKSDALASLEFVLLVLAININILFTELLLTTFDLLPIVLSHF